jgi:hypothetical protein
VKFLLLLSSIALGLLLHTGNAGADDLLPDLITDPSTLSDIRIDRDHIPGRTLLRMSNMTPNIGQGALEVRAGSVLSPTQQLVDQRIYDDAGGFRDRPSGTFTFHETHSHVHFDDWALYRLRSVTATGGVGGVVAEGAKTSFCLFDLRIDDATHPNIPPSPGVYNRCDFGVQGISPGWADIYSLELPDQWIDITDLPLGDYWLEAVVDPEDRLLEEDEGNNAARIRVSTLAAPVALPDRFEENDSFAQVRALEVGGVFSPNLGALDGGIVLENLSLEDASDYFRFELLEEGVPGSHVRVDSPFLGHNINLALFTDNQGFIERSTSRGSVELVSLAGLPAGVYFARVFPGAAFVQNPDYTLTIDIAENAPPTIQIIKPASEPVWIEGGFETVAIQWLAQDPDGDTTLVSLFVGRQADDFEAAQPLGSYQGLEGDSGAANVNTALFDLGKWFFYATVTDGDTLVTAGAKGVVVIYAKGDFNFDGHVDREDWKAFVRTRAKRELPQGWRVIFDMNRDGTLSKADRRLFRAAIRSHDSHEHDDGH